jgi:hypothetical protein
VENSSVDYLIAFHGVAIRADETDGQWCSAKARDVGHDLPFYWISHPPSFYHKQDHSKI